MAPTMIEIRLVARTRAQRDLSGRCAQSTGIAGGGADGELRRRFVRERIERYVRPRAAGERVGRSLRARGARARCGLSFDAVVLQGRAGERARARARRAPGAWRRSHASSRAAAQSSACSLATLWAHAKRVNTFFCAKQIVRTGRAVVKLTPTLTAARRRSERHRHSECAVARRPALLVHRTLVARVQ